MLSPVFSENETTMREFNVCNVTLTQTEGKRSSGSRASAEAQPRPSEERGRHLGPQRQAGRLQEADPAGPEGGKQVNMLLLHVGIWTWTKVKTQSAAQINVYQI